MMDGGNSDRRGWHVGKEIPLALIGVVIVQTVGLVIWATRLDSTVATWAGVMQEWKLERYTKDDGRRDQQFIVQLLEMSRQADREHERRILNLENAFDRERGNLGIGLRRPQ